MDYIDKSKKTALANAIVVTPNTSEGLVADNIKTELQGKTAIVKDPNTYQVLHHIILRNVNDWYREGKTLVIEEVNNTVPIKLTFITKFHAESADNRFTKIMNGGILL